MYCSKCGKELQDGQVCDCQKNVSVDQKQEVINSLKGLFKRFLQNPFNAMEEEYASGKITERLYAGGVSAAALLLFSLVAFATMLDFGGALKYAILFTLLTCVVKAGFAGALYLVGKKNGADFKNVSAEVCYASLPQAACFFVVGAAFVLKLYSFAGILIFFYAMVTCVMGFLTSLIVLKENRKVCLWFYFAVCFAVIILVQVFGQQMALSFVQSIYSDMMNSLW